MCVTIKDFILKYDYNFRSIAEYSLYDTKTVNIFNTITENTTKTQKKENTGQGKEIIY